MLYASCCVIIIGINAVMYVDGHDKLDFSCKVWLPYPYYSSQLDNNITRLHRQLTINNNYPVHGKLFI